METNKMLTQTTDEAAIERMEYLIKRIRDGKTRCTSVMMKGTNEFGGLNELMIQYV